MKEENIRYILENVISKAQYNQQIGKYVILESDYLNLKLSTNKMKLLKAICENLDIELEYIGYTRMLLPCVENELLFKEYNETKRKLEKDPKSYELEQKRIELRNQIAIDNIDFVKSILDRRIDTINDMQEKEDIYQLGYEVLINFIDGNYLFVDDFKDRVSKLLLLNVSRKLISENEGISYRTKEYLMSVVNNDNSTTTVKVNNITKELQVEELKILEEILSPISLEETIDNLRYEEDNSNSPLYDDTFEERIINKYSQKEIILKIISTLPRKEREILILYFGLNNNNPYNMTEIASMYGLTKSRISAIINKALKTIRTSIRIKYLQEIYDIVNISESIFFQQDELEETLILSLPKDIIDKLITKLPTKYEMKMLQTCHQNPEANLKTLSEKVDCSLSYAQKIKQNMIENIRNIIIDSLQEDGNTITYEDYLDYLMKLYLSNKKVRRKGKN